MPRLPTPGGDNNTWGNILNDYLEVEHNLDGSQKPLPQSTIINLPSDLAAKADDNSVVHNTGNEPIAGTKNFSSSPIIPTPTLGSQATNKTYVDNSVSAGAPDATTTNKGLVQLAGDLAGTAASPTVSFSNDTLHVLKAGDTMTGDLSFSGSQKLIGGSSTTADLTLQTTSGVGATGADMHFLVGSNGATEALTVLNGGNVGIGTTNPVAKLDVAGKARIDIQAAPTSDGRDTEQGAGYFEIISTNGVYWTRFQQYEFGAAIRSNNRLLEFMLDDNGGEIPTAAVGISPPISAELQHELKEFKYTINIRDINTARNNEIFIMEAKISNKFR